MSANPIDLRPATEADLPTLLTILHAAFEEYRGKLDPPSGTHLETLETLRSKLGEGGAFLAFSGGVPAGCVFFEVHDDYVYLGRLSVLPKYRKQGLAHALIEAVEQQAHSLGKTRIQLGTRLALPGLIDYYTRLGYRPISYVAHEGYSQPTYVIMERTL